MALTDAQKLDYVFKAIKSLGMTSPAKAYYEESEPGGIIIDNKDLWTDSVPSTAPGSTGFPIKAFIPSPGDGRLLLTEDGTVASSKAWKAISGGNVLKEWVSPAYGTSYAARIFKSDNSTEIPTTDSSDWIFDYKAGVITFQDACPDTGGIYLHAFRYEGNVGAPTASGATIAFVIDGGGNDISVGEHGHLRVPFNCIIKKAAIFGDTTGSITLDIWKDTYANYPPDNSDSITASAPLTVTDSNKTEDTTLTGWTTGLNVDDVLAFNVDSCGSITRASINLLVVKT